MKVCSEMLRQCVPAPVWFDDDVVPGGDDDVCPLCVRQLRSEPEPEAELPPPQFLRQLRKSPQSPTPCHRPGIGNIYKS